MESLSAFEAVFHALNEKLRPIAERPIDTGEADWEEALASRPHPLDEAGERDQAERLLTEVSELYATGLEPDRIVIRGLFRRYRYVN